MYDLSFFDDYGNEYETYEGAFLGFEREGGGPKGLTYRFHPLEVIWRLKNHRQFRHINLPELCKLVIKFGNGRTTYKYWFEKYFLYKLERIEIDIELTSKKVAAAGGLSCSMCDNLVIPVNYTEDGLYDSIVNLESKAIFENISHMLSDFNLLGYYLPVFCDSCEKSTRHIIGYLDEAELVYLKKLLFLYKTHLTCATFRK